MLNKMGSFSTKLVKRHLYLIFTKKIKRSTPIPAKLNWNKNLKLLLKKNAEKDSKFYLLANMLLNATMTRVLALLLY